MVCVREQQACKHIHKHINTIYIIQDLKECLHKDGLMSSKRIRVFPS